MAEQLLCKKTLSSSAEGKWIKLTGSWETAHHKDRRARQGKRKNNTHITRRWGLGDASGWEWLAFRSTAWIWLWWAITPNSMACVRARGCERWDYNPGASIQLGISRAWELARHSDWGGAWGKRQKITGPIDTLFQNPQTTLLNQTTNKAIHLLIGYRVSIWGNGSGK